MLLAPQLRKMEDLPTEAGPRVGSMPSEKLYVAQQRSSALGLEESLAGDAASAGSG